MTEARRVSLDPDTAWEVVRAAGGSIPTAAQVLGVTTREVLDALRTERSRPSGTHKKSEHESE